ECCRKRPRRHVFAHRIEKSMIADSPSVILVDDDRALRRATRQTLELAAFDVADFPNALETLNSVTSAYDGVVVTDVRMPQIDGLQLFARIKAIDAELPVILITGHGYIPMDVQAIQERAYDLIAKPFATDRLVTSIRRAWEKRQLVHENRALRESAQNIERNL